MKRAIIAATLLTILAVFAACTSTPAPASQEIPVTVEVTRLVPVEVTRRVAVEKTVRVTRIVKETVLVNATVTPHYPRFPTESLVVEQGDLTGAYDWTTDVEGQGCWLNIEHKILKKVKDGFALDEQERIKFDVECCRGAPSYNLGSAWGEMNKDGDLAVYHRYHEFSGETCDLIFTFSKNGIKIDQVGDSMLGCGFGHGVTPYGTYHRTTP